MGRVPAVVARKHEADALAFKLANPKATWDEVAQEVGLGSGGAAYDACFRPIKKSVAAGVGDMQLLIAAQIADLKQAVWPIATGDIQTVLQYIGKGKDKEPVLCEGHEEGERYEHRDEPGRQVCYVIPSEAMVKGIDKAQALIKQETDIFGLKHSDGIADRQTAVMEKIGSSVGDIVMMLIEKMGMGEVDAKRAQLIAYDYVVEEEKKLLDVKTA